MKCNFGKIKNQGFLISIIQVGIPMRHIIERVHGIPFKEIKALVNQEWSESEDILELYPENIGGWSNINILGTTSAGKIVIKLPAYIGFSQSKSYHKEFEIADYLSRQNLCPPPLSSGFLDDNKRVPYILYQFVEGLVYQSSFDISSTHLVSLKESLNRLAKTKPPNIMDYYEPSSLIGNILKALAFPKTNLAQILVRYREIRNELETIGYTLMDIMDSMCRWDKKTIHGDLQESNIIFQDDRAIFLDVGSCSIADPLYDIAYFLIQAPSLPLSCPQEFKLNEDELAIVESFTPIALLSVTTWTLNRLINQELGLIEANLISSQTTQDMDSYLNSKLTELQKLTNHWK
jgi:hypothetical protein